MSFVHNHKIPLGFFCGLKASLIPRQEIYGDNKDPFLIPGKLTRLCLEGCAIHQAGSKSKLLLQLFFLPLLGKAAGSDDEDLLNHSAE